MTKFTEDIIKVILV